MRLKTVRNVNLKWLRAKTVSTCYLLTLLIPALLPVSASECLCVSAVAGYFSCWTRFVVAANLICSLQVLFSTPNIRSTLPTST